MDRAPLPRHEGTEASVFWGILHRTIFFELVKIFLMSLIALTGLVLLAGIVAEASQRGLSPGQVLAAIPLIIPNTLPYTIPATTLFAANLVYGRLAHDNEITAIKAAGINILKVIWPGAVLGLATTAVTMGLYYYFIPYTQFVLRSQFMADFEEFMYGMLKHERCINHPRLNYAIWVHHTDGRRLLDATFKRRDAKLEYDLIARAREAELRVDSRRGLVIVHMRHGAVYQVASATQAYFEDRIWDVPLPQGYPFTNTGSLKGREMTWEQLLQRRAEVKAELEQIVAEIGLQMTRLSLVQTPSSLPLHISNLKTKRLYCRRELLNLESELNMRPAIAAGCLCFALVGCPVGIWFSKNDYLSAFITCFLPIVMLYYPMLLCGLNLARNNRVPPFVSIWACDAVLAFIALLLLRKLLRN